MNVRHKLTLDELLDELLLPPPLLAILGLVEVGVEKDLKVESDLVTLLKIHVLRFFLVDLFVIDRLNLILQLKGFFFYF